MDAITLWEPWAAAMALELKLNETRSWPTSFRGLLAICSAKRKMTREDLDTFEIFIKPHAPNYQITYGAVLCVVEVCDCQRTENISWEVGETEYSLGNYEKGRWAWLTRNCRRLPKPVPVIGRQGFFRLPPEVDVQVREQLAVNPMV